MEHPLKQIGEFGLIDQIRQWFNEETTDLLGIGDDCTVIPRDQDHLDLFTTDLLIEQTHFLIDRIDPADLGHKSLAVNLSDVAAMGGEPLYAWLSIGLTSRTDLQWLESFFGGMYQLANRHKVRLMGGDTTRSREHLMINILVAGHARSSTVKLRSAARPNDVIFVTRELGDSGGGLQLLLDSSFELPETRPDQSGPETPEQVLIRAHNRPLAEVEQGRWLGKKPAVHALIDISDGIASDAGHIANRSGVSMNLEVDQLPLSNALRSVSEKNGWNALELALSAGEDYALLGTCDPAYWEQLQEEWNHLFRTPLYRTGTVSAPEAPPSERSMTQGGFVRFFKNGKPMRRGSKGFDHFR